MLLITFNFINFLSISRWNMRIIYFCEVRWLSKGKAVKRFYGLGMKSSHSWKWKIFKCQSLSMMTGFVISLFLWIWLHLLEVAELEITRRKLVYQLYSRVKSFQAKPCLWETQLWSCNTFNFATFSNHIILEYSSFADKLSSLNNNFNGRFQEFKSIETSLRLFSAPFNIKVDNVLEKIQMVLFELQGNSMLKHNSHESSLQDF